MNLEIFTNLFEVGMIPPFSYLQKIWGGGTQNPQDLEMCLSDWSQDQTTVLKVKAKAPNSFNRTVSKKHLSGDQNPYDIPLY